MAGVFLPILAFKSDAVGATENDLIYDSVFFLMTDNYQNALVFWTSLSYIFGSVVYAITCFSSNKYMIILSGISLLGISVGGCYFLFTHIGLGTIYALIYLLNIVLYFYNIKPALALRKSIIYHKKSAKR